MVSLSRSYNTNSGGATFFSESVNMDDRELLLPVLDSFGGFTKIPTLPICGVHLLFVLILNILAIVFAVAHPHADSKCTEYFVITYLHVALWFITFAIHLITKHVHHQVRLNGYLEFFKNTQVHTSFPLIVVSLWTVALHLVQTVMQHYYQEEFEGKCLKGGILSPRAYICALITLEFGALAGIYVDYMKKVLIFNRQQAPPDVLKSEWLSAASPKTFSQYEVGYREMGSKVFNFLEKQADLICFLKEHNARLAQKVMTLSPQLRNENLASVSTST